MSILEYYLIADLGRTHCLANSQLSLLGRLIHCPAFWLVGLLAWLLLMHWFSSIMRAKAFNGGPTCDFLCVFINDKTGQFHGGYMVHTPNTYGLSRFVLQWATTTGYDSPDEAALAIESWFRGMPKTQFTKKRLCLDYALPLY